MEITCKWTNIYIHWHQLQIAVGTVLDKFIYLTETVYLLCQAFNTRQRGWLAVVCHLPHKYSLRISLLLPASISTTPKQRCGIVRKEWLDNEPPKSNAQPFQLSHVYIYLLKYLYIWWWHSMFWRVHIIINLVHNRAQSQIKFFFCHMGILTKQ